ncbi:hypothetical protein ACFFRR_010658 [Megaselia abdita]
MNKMYNQMSYNKPLELKTRVSILKQRELSYSPKNLDAAEYFTQRKVKKTPNRVTYLRVSNDLQIIEKLLEILNNLKGIQSTQCFTYKNRPQSAFIKVLWNGDINFLKEYEILKTLPFCQIVSAKGSVEENSGSDLEDLEELHISKIRRL